MTTLTQHERRVLTFVFTYGNGIDFGGKGADRKLLNAARALVARGMLSGSERSAALTKEGEAALGAVAAPEKIDPALSVTDLRLIRQIYSAFTQYSGIPYLPAPRFMKRAKALADRGLLLAHPSGAVPPQDWCLQTFTPTPAGITAYNAATHPATQEENRCPPNISTLNTPRHR